MSLRVAQIIYTSFVEVGYKFLVSQQLPSHLEQLFLQNIVRQYWDAYNPPAANYRAVYLHQISPHQTLFGWLYNDGTDDAGRDHTPYFISYYLGEEITQRQLNSILTCLEAGPLEFIERAHPPLNLERLTIPDGCCYEPARPGVNIPRRIQQQSHRQLWHQQLLQLFIPLAATAKEELANQSVPLSSPAPVLALTPQKPRESEKVKQILQDLMSHPLEIQDAALVIISPEGKLMAVTLGWDEKSALMLSAPLLALAQSPQDELNGARIEQIAAHSQAGEIILACLNRDVFLLVKAGKALTGLLEREINRTVKILQEHLLLLD
jgi:predicted regulator of Ras-like GTPase activity (Roadblock/LC7/MglB family)